MCEQIVNNLLFSLIFILVLELLVEVLPYFFDLLSLFIAIFGKGRRHATDKKRRFFVLKG